MTESCFIWTFHVDLFFIFKQITSLQFSVSLPHSHDIYQPGSRRGINSAHPPVTKHKLRSSRTNTKAYGGIYALDAMLLSSSKKGLQQELPPTSLPLLLDHFSKAPPDPTAFPSHQPRFSASFQYQLLKQLPIYSYSSGGPWGPERWIYIHSALPKH